MCDFQFFVPVSLHGSYKFTYVEVSAAWFVKCLREFPDFTVDVHVVEFSSVPSLRMYYLCNVRYRRGFNYYFV